MKKILFQDTSFRDGFQSVFGARVLTDDFLPAVKAAVDAGITHLEAGGGARFQSLFLYCGESAFTMMDRLRETVGEGVNLQTLARGINVVALSAQPKDMIDLHARMFKKHGISHIRNFDCLNDVRNLKYSGECITNAGLHHQIAITMMELPPGCEGAHDVDFYSNRLQQIIDEGIPFNSVCFKDASGTSNPNKVYETFKRARKIVGDDVTLWCHTHDTASIGIAQYKAAIEGGCDGIGLARAPVSGGTSQPDLISMQHALKGTGYTLDIDIKKIMEANAVFKDCLKDYYFPPEALSISPEVILSPMPGGALTANTMMMRDTNTLHLYPKVIEAMSECVKRGGFGTSVTPLSQFYFQQAYANVTQGPWKKITDGYGQTVLGYFGKTPVAPDPEIVKLAEEQLGKPAFTGDPLEDIEPFTDKAKKLLKENNLPETEENIFIVSALATPGGNKGLDFLKGNFTVNVRKKNQEEEQSSAPTPSVSNSQSGTGSYRVTVNGKSYDVNVEETTGKIQSVSNAAPTNDATGPGTEVKSSLAGNILNVNVEVGDMVESGEELFVIEAMKMETKIKAPTSGKITSIAIKKGSVVKNSQVLCTIA